VSLRGGYAYVPQHEHGRLDFPVTALDVVLMGLYRRLGLFRPAGRRGRAAAGAPPGRGRPRRPAPPPLRQLSPRPRPPAPLARPGGSPRGARSGCPTSLSPASTPSLSGRSTRRLRENAPRAARW